MRIPAATGVGFVGLSPPPGGDLPLEDEAVGDLLELPAAPPPAAVPPPAVPVAPPAPAVPALPLPLLRRRHRGGHERRDRVPVEEGVLVDGNFIELVVT